MKKYIILIFSLGLVLGINIYFRALPVNFPQLKPQEKAKYQDASGQTYLMELDCWHWARYTENTVRLGHPGDKIAGGKQIDSLMLAPLGAALGWNSFLFYLSARLYKIFSFAYKPIPLFAFLFYLPLFFSAIFIAALYLFCYHRWGNLSAIVACLFAGLSPIFLGRSCAGWFDTDIFNLFFPLLICWAHLKAYDSASFKMRALWLCLSGFWLGLFSFTWNYWWFIFLIILGYEIYTLAILAFLRYRGKENAMVLLKRHLLGLPVFSLFGLFWIILFSGIAPLEALYAQVKGALVLTGPLSASLWPNVLSTVEELRRPDFIQILHNLDPFLFTAAASFACMLMLFIRPLRNPQYNDSERELSAILTFWFAAMFFASFKGIRFTMFLLVPLAVSLGWVIEEAYGFFRAGKQKWQVFLTLGLAIVFCVNLVINGYEAAKGIRPLMNDAYYKTLTAIKEKTPEKAIINSWWDFGDWFKVVAGRRVIFDGQSQNTPLAHWMARVLLSDNEEEAISILRRLNNGAPAYFVVDYTMLKKMPAISFLGNWDFLKASRGQAASQKQKFHSSLLKGEKKENIILFDNGLVYNPRHNTVYMHTQGGYKIPRSLFLFNGNKIKETVFPDNEKRLKYSVLILKEKDDYAAVLLDRQLAKSLFVRLYFLNAKGLKHFKPFIEEKTDGGYIRVFEIVWDQNG